MRLCQMPLAVQEEVARLCLHVWLVLRVPGSDRSPEEEVGLKPFVAQQGRLRKPEWRPFVPRWIALQDLYRLPEARQLLHPLPRHPWRRLFHRAIYPADAAFPELLVAELKVPGWVVAPKL